MNALPCSIALFGSCAVASSALGQVDLRWPESIGGFSLARGVSRDGQVVAGGDVSATVWSGLTRVPIVPGAESMAVSANGSTVVGYSQSPPNAFTWSQSGGFSSLPPPAGSNAAQARGVSGDGRVVVGYSSQFGNEQRAVRWIDAGVPEVLPVVDVMNRTVATAANADGTVIVGYGINAPYATAFRWTEGGVEPLGFFGGGNHTAALAVSADGKKIAGYGTATYGRRAIRWTEDEGFRDLGVLPSTNVSEGLGIDDTGHRIVGYAYSETDLVYRPFLWTPSGMIDLHQYVQVRGLLPFAARLQIATAISGDGSTVVGYGTLAGSTRAFVITGLDIDACPSDIAGPNQSIGPDGVLTADDIIVFLGWFFTSDARADIAGPNQSTTPDTNFTADDIIVFLGRFFAGC